MNYEINKLQKRQTVLDYVKKTEFPSNLKSALKISNVRSGLVESKDDNFFYSEKKNP